MTVTAISAATTQARFGSINGTTSANIVQTPEPANKPRYIRGAIEAFITEKLIKSALRDFQPHPETGKRRLFLGALKMVFALIFGRRTVADFFGQFANRNSLLSNVKA